MNDYNEKHIGKICVVVDPISLFGVLWKIEGIEVGNRWVGIRKIAEEKW